MVMVEVSNEAFTCIMRTWDAAFGLDISLSIQLIMRATPTHTRVCMRIFQKVTLDIWVSETRMPAMYYATRLTTFPARL